MALTLKAPPPADRQLTESKWEVAEQALRENASCHACTILTTPQHAYTLVREPDGSLTRHRTKSQEEPNVDVAPSPCAGGGRDVLVGAPKDAAGETLRSLREDPDCLADGLTEG
jgi:hypothetical protein